MNPPKIPSENRRNNMEPRRTIEGNVKRKPLADCTNTVSSRSSQQPSSSSSPSLKFSNPSLTSSLKRIVDQTTLKEKTNHVRNTPAASGIASKSLAANLRPVPRRTSAVLAPPRIAEDQTTLKEKNDDVDSTSKATSPFLATNSRPVTRRMSHDLDFPASAPPPSRPSDHGVSEKEFDAPYSVYTVRRKASGRKRSQDASSSSSALPRLRFDLISSSRKKASQASEKKPKPLKVAPKKKQRTIKHEKDNLVHGVPKDYIEQQKAYFAEIDAFELEEEEVSSSDLD